MIRKLKNLGHLLEAMAACVYYGFPSRRLKVIGVTGTDGKTTTTSLIYHILKSAGKKVSMISTVYAKVGEETFDTGLHTTTPPASLVQKLLKKSVDSGDEYFVLETTSHALDQNRIYGVHFEIGIITNITHEHIDYHKTYEAYGMTKAALLLGAKIPILNRDDQSYDMLRRLLKLHHRGLQSYGLKKDADFRIDIEKKLDIKLPEFNQYNYLAAYAAAWLIGIDEKIILQSIKSFKLPPGRMEIVHDGAFQVIVDFAHTPNAVLQVLKAVKSANPEPKRIIHVFSAAGLRDVSKRPLMGAASAVFSDVAILTEEDYRTEDPKKINEQIAQGLLKKNFQYIPPQYLKTNSTGKYTMIIDRQRAIKRAVDIAADGDVIIITGKGHEQSLCRGTKEYPWDDRQAVKNVLINKS